MTTEAQLFGQGMAFPPQLDRDGRVSWSSGPANVREAIRVILMTDPGERIMLPSFGAGLRKFLFEPNVAATHRLVEEAITHALLRWEPRIRLGSVEVAQDPVEPQQANVTINYTLVATRVQESVSVAVRLEG